MGLPAYVDRGCRKDSSLRYDKRKGPNNHTRVKGSGHISRGISPRNKNRMQRGGGGLIVLFFSEERAYGGGRLVGGGKNREVESLGREKN